MIIEIRRAGFVNKGAELMLHAVLQKMKQVFPDAVYVMAPGTKASSAPYEKRAEHGFYQKAWLWRYGIQWGDLGVLAPRKLREMYGVVLDREVDIVLDAAGFSYSDQWGDANVLELARSAKRWRRRGTKVILLPQAFGPFTSARSKRAVKSFVQNVDLLFSRDPISHQHLTDIVGQQSNIRQYPDFTNLVEGILPEGFNVNANRFCIIPNYRMVDKTEKRESEAYIPFLIRCAKVLLEKGVSPFVLVHEGPADYMLAEKVSAAVGGLPIVKETNPLKIKGIIGACFGTLGSRFHGLVSALSQGVPSLATGWSHKYQALFEEYGFKDGLMDVCMDETAIRRKFDLILNPESREMIVGTLGERSKYLKSLSEQMWQEVFAQVRRR